MMTSLDPGSATGCVFLDAMLGRAMSNAATEGPDSAGVAG